MTRSFGDLLSAAIRSDNGREFIATSVVSWLAAQGVEAVFIEKASPQQNPFVALQRHGAPRPAQRRGVRLDARSARAGRRLEPGVRHATTTSRPWTDDRTRVRLVGQCGSAMMLGSHSHVNSLGVYNVTPR